MRLSTAELSAIEQRAKDATEGPWEADTSVDWSDYENDSEWYCWQTKPPEGEWPVPGYGTCEDPDDCEGHKIIRPDIATVKGPKHLYPGGEDSGYYNTEADAEFMAKARTDIPRLVADLRAALAVVEAAKEFMILYPHYDLRAHEKMQAALSAYEDGNGKGGR